MTTFVSYGLMAKYENGILFLEGKEIGAFASLKGCKEYIHGLVLSEEIKETERKESKVEISESMIALELYERGVSKVSESMVSGLKQIVDSKLFYPSDVVASLREKTEHFEHGKIEYTLLDGAKVLLDLETNLRLNKAMGTTESEEKVLFMNKNAENFISVVSEFHKEL